MVADDNKALVRRLVEVTNHGNLDVIDELVAPNCVMHALWPNPVVPPQSPTNASTPEMMKAVTTQRRKYFPDLQVAIDDLLAIDDRVIEVFTRQGTNQRGQHVTWQGINIYRFVDGKIVEIWTSWDRLGYFQQLGVVPATEELLQVLSG